MDNTPKYRAWHKQLNKMMPVLEINLDPEHGGVFVESNDGHHCGCRFHMELWPWSDIELMQWTGRENIYAGDIIRTNNEQEGDEPAEDHFFGVVVYDDQRTGYFIEQPHDKYRPSLHNYYIVSIEVVGNIYEHPELIQNQSQH